MDDRKAPWKIEGTEITKADGDSLDKLIKFNDKHNLKKKQHLLVLYSFIGFAAYLLIKYLIDFSSTSHSTIINALFKKNIFIDFFMIGALYLSSKLIFDQKEKAKDDYHSLRKEIVDLFNKEWVKKYNNQTNKEIYDYVFNVHDIKINYKTK